MDVRITCKALSSDSKNLPSAITYIPEASRRTQHLSKEKEEIKINPGNF